MVKTDSVIARGMLCDGKAQEKQRPNTSACHWISVRRCNNMDWDRPIEWGKLYALFGIFMWNFPSKQSNWLRLKPFTNDDTLIPSHLIWEISHGSSSLRKDNQVGANLMIYCLIYWMLLDLMWKHHAYMHMLNTVRYSFRTLLYRKQEVGHIQSSCLQ